MTVGVPATGPSPSPPPTIAALNARLAALEAAVARLQIDRTPQPLSVGGLSNVEPGLDGAGVADGQTLVYDASRGRYKPGDVGSPYPTLAYRFVAAVNAVSLVNSGPFAVANVGTPVSPSALWAVANGPAFSEAGTFYNQAGPVKAYMNKSTYVSIVGGPSPGGGYPVQMTIPWIALETIWGSGWALGNVTTALVNQTTGGGCCSLPAISTPNGPVGSSIDHHVRIIAANTTCTEWIWVEASVSLPPNDFYQTRASDYTVVNQIGGMTVGTLGLPAIIVPTNGVYNAHCEVGVDFAGSPV